jgi:protein-disulfide isomerase
VADRATLANGLLNGVTAITVLCALTVTALRIRDAVSPVTAAPTDDRLAVRTIRDPRAFRAAGHRIGPADASVTIVEFADFQCPFCRRAAPALRALMRQHPRDLALIYRHYPGHEFSFVAAIASECGARFGLFEPLHDAFYAQAESIGKKPWSRFAREAGWRDTIQFSRCMSDSSMANVVIRDTIAATALGARGTPTFLINDLVVTGYRAAQLDSTIRGALARVR